MVVDPDFGSIAAAIEDGHIVSVGASDPTRPSTNIQPYLDAADLAARELAIQYAETFPEHADWIKEETLATSLEASGDAPSIVRA